MNDISDNIGNIFKQVAAEICPDRQFFITVNTRIRYVYITEQSVLKYFTLVYHISESDDEYNRRAANQFRFDLEKEILKSL